VPGHRGTGRRAVLHPGHHLILIPQRHLGVAVLTDAESALYVATIPRFDLLAMNVAGFAADGSAPAGLVAGFYLIFDLIKSTLPNGRPGRPHPSRSTAMTATTPVERGGPPCRNSTRPPRSPARR
jgi:hypothetical protein